MPRCGKLLLSLDLSHLQEGTLFPCTPFLTAPQFLCPDAVLSNAARRSPSPRGERNWGAVGNGVQGIGCLLEMGKGQRE